MNEVKHMKRHQKHQFEIDSDLHFRVVWVVLIDACHFVGQGWRWLKSLSTPKARWRNLPVNPAYLAPAPSTYHGKLRRSICHLKPTEIQHKSTLHRSVPIHAFFCYRELFSHNLSTIHVPSTEMTFQNLHFNCSFFILFHLFPAAQEVFFDTSFADIWLQQLSLLHGSDLWSHFYCGLVTCSWIILNHGGLSLHICSRLFWTYSLGFSWRLLFDLQWSWRILVYLTLLHQNNVYLLEEYLKIPSR